MSNTKRPNRPSAVTRQRTPKTQQAVIAVIAVLCVVSIVSIPLLLNRSDDSTSATGASHPSPKSAEDVQCDSPPDPPSQPQQFASPPPASLSENATWEATVHTTCGDIRIELDGKAAPQTVASFIYLAQNGYWDDGPCHRLTTQGIFVLQCGDPTGTGGGSPGYSYGVENAPESGDYPRGTLAMARSDDPNSNGGQFFIVYQDTQLPTQTGGYTIFGKVTEGLQVVDAIAAQGGEDKQPDAAPFQPISILSVEVAKKA